MKFFPENVNFLQLSCFLNVWWIFKIFNTPGWNCSQFIAVYMSAYLLFCLMENCSLCGRLEPSDWSKTNNLGGDLADFRSKLFSIKIIILHPLSLTGVCRFWSVSLSIHLEKLWKRKFLDQCAVVISASFLSL